MNILRCTLLALGAVWANTASTAEADLEISISTHIPATLELRPNSTGSRIAPIKMADQNGKLVGQTSVEVLSNVRGAPVQFKIESELKLAHTGLSNKVIPLTATFGTKADPKNISQKAPLNLSYEYMKIGRLGNNANPHVSEPLVLAVQADSAAYANAIAGKYSAKVVLTATHSSTTL